MTLSVNPEDGHPVMKEHPHARAGACRTARKTRRVKALSKKLAGANPELCAAFEDPLRLGSLVAEHTRRSHRCAGNVGPTECLGVSTRSAPFEMNGLSARNLRL
jgi:hypothetical protein